MTTENTSISAPGGDGCTNPECGTEAHSHGASRPTRATLNEVKGMAEHSRVQNAHNRLPNFDASRNILARHIKVLFDGYRVGTVTGFATQLDLSAVARKVRPGVGGGKTLPGEGTMSLDKVNSAWTQWLAETEDLRGFTFRVTVSDPGMPNDEVTEYRGVQLVAFSEGAASLDDLMTQALHFTFLDSEVIQPVEEKPYRDGALDQVWEYAHSTGKLLEQTPAPE